MSDVLVQALSLIAVIVLGGFLRRIKLLSKEDFPKLSKLMLGVTLPAALTWNFHQFQIDFSLLYIIFIGFGVNMVSAAAGYFFNRQKSPEEKAFAVLHGGSYNIGAFAMPYLNAFMGPESLIYSSLFDIGNAVSSAGVNYSWALGLAKGEKTSLRGFVLRMFHSPVFVTYIFLLFLQLFRLRLPEPIIHFAKLAGSGNTFLAMLIIGLGLELKLPRHKLKKAFGLLLRRYLLAVLFLFITWFGLPAGVSVRRTICVLYFAPLAAMISGFTAEADGDIELSSFINSITILVGIVAMPLLIALLR